MESNSKDGMKDGEEGWTVSYRKKKEQTGGDSKTVYLVGIADRALTREVWSLMGHIGGIKDIILPKKRDRFGNRIGFVKVANTKVAKKVIWQIDEMVWQGKKLKASMARQTRNNKYTNRAEVKENKRGESNNNAADNREKVPHQKVEKDQKPVRKGADDEVMEKKGEW